MPARIAHISDTHLGTRPGRGVKHNVWGVELRTRLLENDFYERFAEVFDIIANLDPPVDLVVHSGDLYNSPWEGNPQQPPIMAQETTISTLQNFIESTGIPVLILEGNHGIYRSLRVSLLDSLKLAIPDLEIATQQDLRHALSEQAPLVHSFEKLDVFCFPFMERNVLESAGILVDFTDWITTFQRPDSKKPSVAVAHGMDLDGSLYSDMFSMGYDYIALGHDHHQHKHAKNVWYAGSPERWRFDEIRHEKGFLVVDIEDNGDVTINQHPLEYKRPVYNEQMSIEDDDSIESVIGHIEDWFETNGIKADWDPKTAARVRLVFDRTSLHVSSLDLGLELENLRMKALSQNSGYNLVQFVWTIKQTTTKHEEASYPEIESEYLIENPEEDFRAYLETLDIDEKYDESILTRIAVQALLMAVDPSEERLTFDKITEDTE